MAGVKLSENHKRAISTTLTVLDELIVCIEKWVDGHQYRSVLYQEKNDLNSSHRKALKKQTQILQDYLDILRKDMAIKKTTQSAVNDIWSRVSAFRENIMELEAKHMKRYGEISSESQIYLNNLSKKLLAEIDRILQIIKE